MSGARSKYPIGCTRPHEVVTGPTRTRTGSDKGPTRTRTRSDRSGYNPSGTLVVDERSTTLLESLSVPSANRKPRRLARRKPYPVHPQLY